MKIREFEDALIAGLRDANHPHITEITGGGTSTKHSRVMVKCDDGGTGVVMIRNVTTPDGKTSATFQIPESML